MTTNAELRSKVERLWRRMQGSVHHARTTTAPTEGGPVSSVQLKVNDQQSIDNAPIAFHFGFQACLPNGSDVVRVTIAGDMTNGVVVATNHIESRPGFLQPGEAILYNMAGDHVHMKADRSVEVKANSIDLVAEAQVSVKAPQLITTGNVVVGTGASGSFTTPTGQIVTVADGIIINII